MSARRTVVPITSARSQHSAADPVKSSEILSGLDPYTEHCQFPDRWRAYLVAHFGTNPQAVADAFGVTERAARKWLNGETGCKGCAVVIAVQLHPETAPPMLWAAE